MLKNILIVAMLVLCGTVAGCWNWWSSDSKHSSNQGGSSAKKKNTKAPPKVNALGRIEPEGAAIEDEREE